MLGVTQGIQKASFNSVKEGKWKFSSDKEVGKPFEFLRI